MPAHKSSSPLSRKLCNRVASGEKALELRDCVEIEVAARSCPGSVESVLAVLRAVDCVNMCM
jgi:hypothetical protein